MRKFKITVEGIPYVVSVEELDSAALASADVRPPSLVSSVADAATGYSPPSTPNPSSAPAVGAQPGDVSSPLSGTVTKVDVSVGQAVKEGDPLLHLEAMKMESAVVAPKSGKVDKIKVSAGQQVQEGQILLTIS